MLDILTRPEQVSSNWLTQALRQSGCLGDAEVVNAEHKIIGTGKMGDNARFKLTYSGDHKGAPDSVIIKFPAEDEMARAIAGARGAYYTEVMFYRHLADRTSMRTPLIYANEISEDRLDFITVMEDMTPAEPGSQLVGESLEHAQIAMKEAAKLASAFYGDESVAKNDYVLTQSANDGGAMGYDLLQQYWPAFLERFGHSLNSECKAFGDTYVNNHKAFVNRFKGPKTLVHGDFRSENILFSQNKICTVDWQTILESSALADLSYFMGGSIEVADRRLWEKDIVKEYSEVLAGLGVNLGFDECWNQYREQAMHGLMMSILGACFSEAEERSDAMFMAMIQRHLQHCVDLDSSEFLA